MSACHRVYLSPSLQIHNSYVRPPGGIEEGHMRPMAEHAAVNLRHSGLTVRLSSRAWRKLSDADYLARVVADSNSWEADVHVAIHSNAGSAGAAGTDTFYHSGDAASRRLAALLQKHVAPLSPGKDGGLHANATFAEVHGPQAPAALIEVGFHTNRADARSIADRPAAYGNAIAEAVCEFLGVRVQRPFTGAEKKRLRKRLAHAPPSALRWLRLVVKKLLRT